MAVLKTKDTYLKRLCKESDELADLHKLFDRWEESGDVVAMSYAAQAKSIGQDRCTKPK